MFSHRRNGWMCIALLILPAVFLLSCSSSTEQKFAEGKLYVVNNTNPSRVKKVQVIWDEVTYDLPFNMNADRTPTSVGAIELTDSPLPGGLSAELTYGGALGYSKKISILIDGNMTVEIYMESWEGTALKAQIFRGKWDGIHSY